MRSTTSLSRSGSFGSKSSRDAAFDGGSGSQAAGHFEFRRRTTEDDEDELKWAAIERLPTLEIRFEGLSVEGDGYVGTSALPTLLNFVVNTVQQVSGRVTYCGHEFHEFVPQKTCAYISQHECLLGELTVRETLEFSSRCLGVGTKYDLLAELSRREKEAGIMQLLGLDLCANIIVGNDMRRGISGGQKKRVTTGEMLVGPAKVFLMDEISTGLDSSTTYQIVRFMKQMVHIMDVTMVISLLQPAPETYELFDDIILISENHIVYQGPRENVLEFFKNVGFKCPERKGVADFLQEVTSRNDQEQYWFRINEPYRYISVSEFVMYFKSFTMGRKRNAFIYIFKSVQLTIMSIICMTMFFRTEMFYGALFYILINIMFNGISEMILTTQRLPVFYKERDSLLYPAWAFALPIWMLRVPISFGESFIWIALTYYTIGFAPSIDRFFKQFLTLVCINQMAQGLFRSIAAVARSVVAAPVVGMFMLLVIFVFDDIQPWLIWGYYISPMMYAQNAIMINEFLDERWSGPNPDSRITEATVGKALLKMRGMFVENKWYWISIGALIGFTIIYNTCFILALTYLDSLEDSKTVILDDNRNKKSSNTSKLNSSSFKMSTTTSCASMKGPNEESRRRGMVLPFKPLSLAFKNVNYYVDMPAEMKSQGVEEERLQLLHDVSGAFRPGILTALVGNQRTFARISGYCEQNDIHSPRITVYESLLHSAWLRLPKSVNKQDRTVVLLD
ncbi:unnamed protein product [Linum tenue]|uniref:ABC transporter domain-containing protein n=1 Tax=Linum tenue TaxID=586396 RepID=A0AAV0JLB2_9ROSI|nr:unnamed protein product [Linum tenue]